MSPSTWAGDRSEVIWNPTSTFCNVGPGFRHQNVHAETNLPPALPSRLCSPKRLLTGTCCEQGTSLGPGRPSKAGPWPATERETFFFFFFSLRRTFNSDSSFLCVFDSSSVLRVCMCKLSPKTQPNLSYWVGMIARVWSNGVYNSCYVFI